MNEKKIVFRRYPLKAGQKIFIQDGPRKGDWTVVKVDEKKVGLKCPVKGTEVSWNRFCYSIEE